MKYVTVALLTPSPVIAAGFTAVLGKLRDPSVTLRHFAAVPSDSDEVLAAAPTLVIADPCTLTPEAASAIRNRCHLTALYLSALPIQTVRQFDDTISVYDPVSDIERIIREVAVESASGNVDRQELSPREKEVVVGIVKGLSNKEIAAEINVSVNTVMTHRRNIAQKLQIHSPAGLTIYAIVKKLVRLDEIRSTIE